MEDLPAEQLTVEPLPVGPLLDALGDRRRAVRAQAVDAASRLSPDDLLQLLEANGRRYQKRRRWEIPVVYGSLALCVSFALLCTWGIVNRGWDVLYGVLLVLLAPFPTALIGSTIERLAPDNRVQDGLAAVLADKRTPDFVSPVLVLLSMPIPIDRQKVRRALEMMLPQVRAEEANRWTARQRRALTHPLRLMLDPALRNSPKYPERFTLFLQVLKLLERVGDERELGVVQRLASVKWLGTERDRQLQRAAQECLPYLQIRADEQRQAKTLLRASDASDAAAARPDTLLRPADTAPAATPPDQLVRPTSQS